MILTVQSIFKILIGTIVVLFISSIVVELFNITTTGLQINQISKISAKQSCVLFSQETYKQHGSGGAVNMAPVVDANGQTYVEGKFYDSNTPEGVFNDIYTGSDSTFDEFVNSPAAKDANGKFNWYNLKLIDRAINHPDTLNVTFETHSADNNTDYNEAMLAKLYKSTLMTPSNLGIPYLDKKILNRMFKWNITQILSNCNPASILTDEYGNKYVSYKGFRVYTDKAIISDLEYKTFDLSVKGSADYNEFVNITNISPDKLGFKDDTSLSTTLKLNGDERKKVCLVGIHYSVPMTYQGITPIKQIFNYIWNTEVTGLNQGSGRQTYEQWNDSIQNLESGGLEGNTAASGVLPVPGKLIYYIIK